MSQSKKMSLVESLTNTVGGFLIALGCQETIFPWFGISISLGSSVGIACHDGSVARAAVPLQEVLGVVGETEG